MGSRFRGNDFAGTTAFELSASAKAPVPPPKKSKSARRRFARNSEGERQVSPGVASCRLHPASTATVGKRTASGHRRFFNDHLLFAPRYRWWLRQILRRFVI
jgi:hypothetical protein